MKHDNQEPTPEQRKIIESIPSIEMHATSFQTKLAEAIKNAPTPLRHRIFVDIETEIKKQRAFQKETQHIGTAMLNGGEPRLLCEMQYEVFRRCCIVANDPDQFHAAWLQMICCAVMIYEDMATVLEAVQDATSAPEGSIIITDQTKL